MKIEEALSGWLLEDYRKSAVSASELNAQILEFYLSKKYKGDNIDRIRKDFPEKRELERVIDNLLEMRIIKNSASLQNFNHRPYYYISAFSGENVESVVCSIYKYGYISYISSMNYYGVTDRLPKEVHFTSCSPKIWRLSSYNDFKSRFPTVKNKDISYFLPSFPNITEIMGFNFINHTTSKYVEPKKSSDGVKVQDIGLLFLDILREPDYSGGISHVISVFREYSEKYSRRIITQTDIHGTAIDKARIGFLLEKVLNIRSDIIQGWKNEKSNQRGGSRKLFSSRKFVPYVCSEWNISLNHEELYEYAD